MRRTKKKLTHKELLELIDQVPGMVYQIKLDPEQNLSFNFVSRGIETFGGGAPEDLENSLSFLLDLLHPSEFHLFFNSIYHSAATMSEWNQVFRYNHPDKGPSWGRGRSFPKKQKDGSVIWNGFLSDVTQEKMLEMSLKQAIEVRDAFISIASHELKTPLTVLLMQIQMMKRKFQDVEGLGQEINRAIGQIDRITRHINNFFENSPKTDGQELPYEESSYDLGLFIQDHVNNYYSDFFRDTSRVTLDLEEGVETYLSKDKISQVLSNLISNSFKYAPNSKVMITLRKKYQNIELIIADDGPGIPINLLPNIFNRYQKSDNEYSISGIGLGLFVTKKIVDLLKGRINLHTSPGKGTLLQIQFPLGDFLNLSKDKNCVIE